MRLYELGKTNELHRLAHTFKGVAGSLGAFESFQAARELETALQIGSSKDTAELVVTLAKSIQAALAAANKIG